MRSGTTILTKEKLDSIPALIVDGLSNEQIAAQLGCTLGTLKVRCSKHGISLSRRPARTTPPPVPRPPPKAVPQTALQLQISRLSMLRLQKHANDKGLVATRLAAELLEMIITDDLYVAVLDHEPAS
jgi:hypothetical protein